MVPRYFFVVALFVARAAMAAPLPYVTEPALKEIKFNQAIAIVSAPGDTQRLFVLEKEGRIIVIDDLAHPTRRVFLDITGRVGDSDSEQGILALAFHPDFQRNRQFYVWYTSCLTKGGRTVREDRLSRFTASDASPAVGQPSSELPMIAQADEASNHNGGQLLFGPDGYLYLSLGDEGAANDRYGNSQRIDKDFFSGILRLDVDHRPGSLTPNAHPSVRPGSYAIPADNPYVGATTFNGKPLDPARVRTEYWAVGLRNPWRMAFDFANGQLWCADVGQNLYEEVDLIVRGGNYGWNLREAAHSFRGTPPAEARLIDPIWEYPRSSGLSITGGLVYRGDRYPDLVGRFLFADYVLGQVWALLPDGDKPVSADRVPVIAQATAVVSFGLDPHNGDILLASLTGDHLLRLVPNRTATKP